MIITNGKLITWQEQNSIHEGWAIYVENGKIADIGPEDELVQRYPSEERLDAGGQYVMPGNICAHTHFYGAFSRGMALMGTPPKNFTEILQKLWWPLDRALQPEDVRLSALVCLVDAIRHGTTSLVDHHASPEAINGSLDVIADAVKLAGVRASLCYEVTDRNGPAGTKAGIRENLRFIDRIQRGDDAEGRLSALFGLHASLTVSDETLAQCRQQTPDGVGFHIHVAEDLADQDDSLQKYGLRVVDRLARHKLLGPNSIAVHAVHVDAKEIQTLAETGTWVTHQPRSNMNNAVGVADIEAMLRFGVQVCLGNDGFSNTMWEEWKTAYLVHKLWNHNPRRMPGDLLAKIAIKNNAALINQLFPRTKIGTIEVGAQADVIFVDYHPFTPLTPDNLPWHIVFGFHESMITTTMVAGKLLMHHRELLTLDEERIAYEAHQRAPLIWERYRSQF